MCGRQKPLKKIKIIPVFIMQDAYYFSFKKSNIPIYSFLQTKCMKKIDSGTYVTEIKI